MRARRRARSANKRYQKASREALLDKQWHTDNVNEVMDDYCALRDESYEHLANWKAEARRLAKHLGEERGRSATLATVLELNGIRVGDYGTSRAWRSLAGCPDMTAPNKVDGGSFGFRNSTRTNDFSLIPISLR